MRVGIPAWVLCGLAAGCTATSGGSSGGTASSTSSSSGAASSSSSSSTGGTSTGGGSSGVDMTMRLPNVWSTPMGYAGDLVADATHAYVAFTYPGLEGIHKIALDTGMDTLLWNQPVQRLLEDGQNLVAVAGNSGGGNYEVYVVPKDGTAPTLWCTTTRYIYSVALTPTRLVMASGFDGHRLVACPRPNGAEEDLYVDAAAPYAISKVLASGEDLVFTTGKEVFYLAQGSNTPVLRFTVAEDFTENVVVAGANIWAASGIYQIPGGLFGTGAIYVAPLVAGDVRTILAMDSGLQGLTVGPNHVFVYNYGYMGLGRVVQLDHDGANFTPLAWDKGAREFNLVGNRLVWTSYASEDPYPEGASVRMLTVTP